MKLLKSKKVQLLLLITFLSALSDLTKIPLSDQTYQLFQMMIGLTFGGHIISDVEYTITKKKKGE